jgi:hypothetical protein
VLLPSANLLGRLDFNVSDASVDLNEPRIMAGIDAQEHSISHQFVQLAKNIHSIRETILVYRHLKRKDSSYAAHPNYTILDRKFDSWFAELPADLQIRIPENEYDAWEYSSFLGNLHSYHYLSIIMHYRPQFHYWVTQPTNDAWKRPLLICLEAAKKMCRIHESMLGTVGLIGFESMLRGMSYTIYAVLTCTSLQLVSHP